MRSLFRGIPAAVLFTLLLASSSGVLASISPTMRIQQTVNEVLQVLANSELDTQQRRELVRNILRPRFDYRAMSQIILAQNWRKATPEQQDQFISLFRELIERTYFSAMDNYSGQKVSMGRERLDGKRAVVETYILASTKKVPVNYKLRLKNDDWFAYDVTIDGVSLVSNYRTSFRNLLREKGMEGLLEELQHKIDTLKSSTTATN